MTSPEFDETEQWIVLGSILRPQGRRGEVLAELLTDFPQSLVGRAELYLAPSTSQVLDGSWRRCQIGSAWLPQGKNAGRVVLAFSDVVDIASAERLIGFEVRTPKRYRLPLDANAAYISDLIGCDLWDGDQVIGVITDIHSPTSPDGKQKLPDAPALLVISTDRGDVMVPFVMAHLMSIDQRAKRLRMNLPRGLVDSQLIS